MSNPTRIRRRNSALAWGWALVCALLLFLTLAYGNRLLGQPNQPPIALSRLSTRPAGTAGAVGGPLRVLPDNPRYFTDGSGQAIYLTGSHTWGNGQAAGYADPPSAFDFARYLDYLEGYGHNFIRLWVWEQAKWGGGTAGDFWIAPQPYQRTGPGTAIDGKLKFDLAQFDEEFFTLLRQHVQEAGARGFYVSVMLFNGWSIEDKGGATYMPWQGHPFHPRNNINGINGDPNGDGQGFETHTLAVAAITALQEAYVRKVIDTVNDLDNVLYEISNESHSAATAWQNHMIQYIQAYEASKPKQHPVGMTVEYPGGSNSELYASAAAWISPNGSLDNPPATDGSKVVLLDTDHLCGICGDRHWVWKSFVRGYNVLLMDPYTGENWGLPPGYDPNAPQWVSMRANMGYTLAYANRLNLAAAAPRGDLCSTGFCLANLTSPGAEFLVYQPNNGPFTVNLSALAGSFNVEWLNPNDGSKTSAAPVSGGGVRTFTPPFTGDAVLFLQQPGAATPTPTPTSPATNTPTALPTGTATPTATVTPPGAATATTPAGGTGTATATAAATATATKTVRVIPAVVGDGAVQVEPAGAIACGQPVTITAIPAAGWQFIGWTGDVVEEQNPLVYAALTGSLSLVANFIGQAAERPYTLTVQVAGEGSVDVQPAGPYAGGQVVMLAAQPAAGWLFTGWDGAQQGSANPLHRQITADTELTANFAARANFYLPFVRQGSRPKLNECE